MIRWQGTTSFYVFDHGDGPEPTDIVRDRCIEAHAKLPNGTLFRAASVIGTDIESVAFLWTVEHAVKELTGLYVEAYERAVGL